MLGGEICARPLVQESVKKAMHRVVVSEDGSLERYEFVLAECIIHALFLSCGLRQLCSRACRHPSRKTDGHDIRLRVALPPLARIV